MRDDPLILDKETGEPKNLWATQRGKLNGKPKKNWKIITVTPHGKRRRYSKEFTRYQTAKKVIAKLEEKYPSNLGFSHTIVSKVVGYGPPRSKVSNDQIARMNYQGLIWCPYCRNFRHFIWSAAWENNRCEVCGIFETDFHVRKNNAVFEWGNR